MFIKNKNDLIKFIKYFLLQNKHNPKNLKKAFKFCFNSYINYFWIY